MTNVHHALIVCCLVLNVFTLQTVLNMTENVAVLLALVVTTVDSHVNKKRRINTSILILNIVCGALSDGNSRLPRQNNHCDCPEGWEGINCNGKIK